VLGNINTESGQKLSQNDGGSPIPAPIPDSRRANRNVSAQFLLLQQSSTESLRDH